MRSGGTPPDYWIRDTLVSLIELQLHICTKLPAWNKKTACARDTSLVSTAWTIAGTDLILSGEELDTMDYGTAVSHRCTALARVVLPAWMAACALFPWAGNAADPTLEALQHELRQIFPALDAPRRDAACLSREPSTPYSIVERTYLWADMAIQTPVALPVTLRQIRALSPPVRLAHIACVKIITPYWHGAGVLISPSGDVLTSYHLVAGAPAVTVQTFDGRLWPISTIASVSDVHDLALVHLEGGPFICLPVTDTHPATPGQHLSIVGHPGDVSWKLSTGEMLRQTSDTGTDVLQFNSDIGRGNSGGPIIDDTGRLCAVTACAARLADGTAVKVGVSARAIQDFLAAPLHPVSLTELASRERNRRAAAFMEEVYRLMDEWLYMWIANMGDVTMTLSDLEGRSPSTNQRVAFANLQTASGSAVQFLMLKALMLRCATVPRVAPQIRASMDEFSSVLDHLISCSSVLNKAGGRTPDEVRLAIRKAGQERTLAARGFARALARLAEFERLAAARSANPERPDRLTPLMERYAPAGCHIETRQPEG